MDMIPTLITVNVLYPWGRLYHRWPKSLRSALVNQTVGESIQMLRPPLVHNASICALVLIYYLLECAFLPTFSEMPLFENIVASRQSYKTVPPHVACV